MNEDDTPKLSSRKPINIKTNNINIFLIIYYKYCIGAN